MINLDLTKAFHPKVGDLLAVFIPGFFVEIGVLAANPSLSQRVIAAFGPNRYIQLFVAVFLALVVGAALIMWVRLIQMLLQLLYGALRRWKAKILDWRLKRAQAELPTPQPGQPPPPTPKSLIKMQKAMQARFDQEQQGHDLQKAWGLAAKQLLKRYGIEVVGTWNWAPWRSVLGEPLQARDWRGYMSVTALHATGWGGVAALYFSPALRIAPFVIFCAFLIGYGLMHDWVIARSLSNPLYYWTKGLDRVLAELKKPHESGVSGEKPAKEQ